MRDSRSQGLYDSADRIEEGFGENLPLAKSLIIGLLRDGSSHPVCQRQSSPPT
jgi:hypothetical protein